MAEEGSQLDESLQTPQMYRRLLLEDICSDIVRYLHAAGQADAFASVTIDREWNLGIVGAFADLRVAPVEAAPYFVEIKTGYSGVEIVQHLRRKYLSETARLRRASKVVVVLEAKRLKSREEVVAAIRQAVVPSLEIEIWDEERLDDYTQQLFGFSMRDPSDEDGLVELRGRISEAKARLAFGNGIGDQRLAILQHSLLWHFGVWRLRELRMRAAEPAASLVRPGHYERAIVLMADLSSFTSFVRDTPDEDVVRASLTAFYTKARYQVINAGGMLYQFVGDEVSAVFGIPDRRGGYIESALRTARGLLEIGRSVTRNWQRRIDRVQPHCAAHIGMAMGDLDLVAQRPFDVGHLGVFGDCINVASRLLQTAAPDEIVISNVLRRALSDDAYAYEERPTVDIKNYGPVASWRLVLPSLTDPPIARATFN
jgi:class 3 adenylate cyclase